MENSKETGRPKAQLSIKTLFWLLFSTACFFGGKHFDELSRYAAAYGEKSNSRSIDILVGNSTTITTNSRIPSIKLGDPSVCDVDPLSPTTFLVHAKKRGVSDIYFIDQNGVKTTYTFRIR